jgi:hypothetical protein
MEDELWQVLVDNGLEEYIPILEDNNIDKEIIAELTEQDYSKLGITGEPMHKMMKLFSKNVLVESVNEETVTSSPVPAMQNSSLEVQELKVIDNSPVHLRLIDNGLSEYIAIFDKNKLDTLDLVSKLNESNLSELGVTAIGDRKKIKDIFNIGDESKEKNNVVVTQTVNTEGTNRGGSTAHTGLAGILGGIIGAITVIVIIFYIISNMVPRSITL